FMTGIKCENHSASIILLKKIYSIDNTKISHAKKERIDKQYYIDFRITKDDAEDIIRLSQQK
ncbi:MAG: DNA-binding protein, partial [archaeon]